MTTLLVTAQPLLGVSAATLSVLAFLPYIINVLRHQTVPQRATWIVWAVLASISASAQLASGDSQALGFAVVQAAATILIALLALANGTRHRLSALERFTLFGAGLGLAAWLITDTPIYAPRDCHWIERLWRNSDDLENLCRTSLRNSDQLGLAF